MSGPAIDLEAEPDDLEEVPLLAPRWRRGVAVVIDIAVVVVPVALLLALGEGWPFSYFLVYLLVPYFAFLDGGKRTLGKLLLRIRVADAETGGAIGWKRAARRALMLVGFAAFVVPLLLDVAVAFRDPYRRCWHDKVTRSVVVSA